MQTNLEIESDEGRACRDHYTSVAIFFQLITIIIMTSYLPSGALGKSFWLIRVVDVALLG